MKGGVKMEMRTVSCECTGITEKARCPLKIVMPAEEYYNIGGGLYVVVNGCNVVSKLLEMGYVVYQTKKATEGYKIYYKPN